jgi:hypothetical protein
MLFLHRPILSYSILFLLVKEYTLLQTVGLIGMDRIRVKENLQHYMVEIPGLLLIRMERLFSQDADFPQVYIHITLQILELLGLIKKQFQMMILNVPQ